MNEQQTVDLKLSLVNVNRIIQLLSTQPYGQVSDLIQNISGQTQTQFSNLFASPDLSKNP